MVEESTTTAPKEPQERKVVHLTDGETPVYYTNNTEFGMTTWDLSLKFARIDRADPDTLYVKDQAVISMSLHHAKALMLILTSYIRQYEQQHGKLSVPIPEDVPGEPEVVKVQVDSNK